MILSLFVFEGIILESSCQKDCGFTSKPVCKMLRQQGAGDSILLKGKTTTRVLVRVCASTCSKQNDLVIEGEFRKVRDPLGPLH